MDNLKIYIYILSFNHKFIRVISWLIFIITILKISLNDDRIKIFTLTVHMAIKTVSFLAGLFPTLLVYWMWVPALEFEFYKLGLEVSFERLLQ